MNQNEVYELAARPIGRIVQFEARNEAKGIEPRFIGAEYYMERNDERILLSGDEVFVTACGGCGRTERLSFNEFVDLMHDGDLYSTMVFCNKCSLEPKSM